MIYILVSERHTCIRELIEYTLSSYFNYPGDKHISSIH